MKPLGSTNEETSSSGNMQMNGSKLKRKRSDSNNCHQCHRNDKEKVVRCKFGFGEDLGFASATKLQYALSDRVNVLMHTAAMCLDPERLSTVAEFGRQHAAQDPVVFSISDRKAIEDAMRNQQSQREIKERKNLILQPQETRS